MEMDMKYIWDVLDKRSVYFFGVGIGLIIAWVTSGIAYLKGNQSTVLFDLILLEFIVSAVLIFVAFLMNTQRGKGRR